VFVTLTFYGSKMLRLREEQRAWTVDYSSFGVSQVLVLMSVMYHVDCRHGPVELICNMAARIRIRGLPSPDEKRSGFISFIVTVIFDGRKKAVMGCCLRLCFIWFLPSDWTKPRDRFWSAYGMQIFPFHQKVRSEKVPICPIQTENRSGMTVQTPKPDTLPKKRKSASRSAGNQSSWRGWSLFWSEKKCWIHS
jgi:hypothetical protein